jgi:UDPglucose 6-dehydrogenase
MMSHIAVSGAGYVGLTTAACFVHLGHKVSVVDVDEQRIDALSTGLVPMYEPGLTDLISEGLSRGSLDFSCLYADALADADFLFVCVPTPDDGEGMTDLSMVEASVEAALPFLESPSLIVIKSTVPVGTCQALGQLTGRIGVEVVSNPEFLQAGQAVSKMLTPSRVVIGADRMETARRVGQIYAAVSAPVVLTDPSSAELIKLASNAYLAVRLSYVNEIAAFASQVGASASDVFSGMGADPRIGDEYLEPGPGWGGSCLPKDSRSLAASGRLHGVDISLIDAALVSNEQQINRVAQLVLEGTNSTEGVQRVGVLGLTFKAGTDDLRDSPAIEVISRLVKNGVAVVAYDPQIEEPPIQGLDIALDPLDAVTGANSLLVLTGWPEFGDLDPTSVAEAMAGRLVVDTRGVLDRIAYEAAGFDVRTIN